MKLNNLFEQKIDHEARQYILHMAKTQLCVMTGYNYGSTVLFVMKDVPNSVDSDKLNKLLEITFTEEQLDIIKDELGFYFIDEYSDPVEECVQRANSALVRTWKQWAEELINFCKSYTENDEDDFSEGYDNQSPKLLENAILDQSELQKRIGNNLAYWIYDTELLIVTDVPNTISPENEKKLWQVTFTPTQCAQLEHHYFGFVRATDKNTHANITDRNGQMVGIKDSEIKTGNWKTISKYIAQQIGYQEFADDFEEDL